MASQPKCSTARARPADPISAARPGSASTSPIRAASPASNAAGSASSYGTSRPVSPSTTTSGMPPTADATTAVPHAIASRLTMPSGSYTEGQTNTVACDSSGTTSLRGSMSEIHTTPSRRSRSSATSCSVSAAISGVSGAPAHSTSCPGRSAAARSRCLSPFCRVIRPTKTAYGTSGSTPCRRSTSGSSVGV